MVQKSKQYWNPAAKGHLAAAGLLSKAAPALVGKNGPVVQRKLASLRAAAKLAHASSPASAPKAQAMKQPPQLAPPSMVPPAGVKPLAIKAATPLNTSLPPKLPTTPGAP